MKTVKMTISVPIELRAKMVKTAGLFNWSAIASEAIAARVDAELERRHQTELACRYARGGISVVGG